MSSWFQIPSQLNQILNKLNQVLINQNKEITQLSALSDLQAAVAALVTEVNSAIALIQGLQSGSVTSADVEAQVAALNQAAAALTAAVIPTPTP